MARLAVVVALVLFLAGAWRSFRGFGDGRVRVDASLTELEPADPSRLEPALADAVRAKMRRIRSDPADAAALGQLGILYEVHELSDLAGKCYAQAMAVDPSEPRWRFHWAVLRHTAGDRHAAEQAMRTVVALQPNCAPAHERLGFWLLDRGAYKEAASAFQRVIELAPRQSPGYLGVARALLGLGLAERAVLILHKALAIHPTSRLAHYTLGRAYQLLGRPADAKREFRRGAAAREEHVVNPWFAQMLNVAVTRVARQQLADARIRNRNFADALSILEPMLALDPLDLGVANNLGLAYISLGRYDDAQRVLFHVLKGDKKSHDSHAHLGIAYFELGEYERALEQTDLALALAPRTDWTHFLRGRILLKLGRLEDAAVALGEAVRLESLNQDVYMQLARVLSTLKRPLEALKPLEAAVTYWPEATELRYNLAMTYAQLGQFERTAAELRTIIKLDPNHEQAWRMLRQAEAELSK